MPLVKCPDCGKEISSSAPSCPHCGRPNTAPRPPTKKGMSPERLTLTVLIIIAVCVIAVAEKNDNKSPASSTTTHSAAPPVETPDQAAARVKRDQLFMNVIRMSGHNCDELFTDTPVIPFVFSHGFSVYCKNRNGWPYHYEIEDKGGNWQITVK
jgi:hypothetical protein